MNCSDLLRRLTDYGEGALDECLCSEIEIHLRDCSPCAEVRRDLEALSRLCAQSPAPRLPAEIRSRIEHLLGSPTTGAGRDQA